MTDDIKLDEEVLYIKHRCHSWRTLKAKGFERDVPLVDVSVWVQKLVSISFINKSFDARGHSLLNKTGQRYFDMAEGFTQFRKWPHSAFVHVGGG